MTIQQVEMIPLGGEAGVVEVSRLEVDGEVRAVVRVGCGQRILTEDQGIKMAAGILRVWRPE